MSLFGLVGKSLAHSFSKSYFEEKFKREGLSNFRYENFELSSAHQIHSLVAANSDLIGFNVTIPYKEKIISALSEVTMEAKEIGAVNTVKLERASGEVKLIGHNTDYWGFHQSVKPFLEGKHERCLILGAGGVSKAVVYVLGRLGISTLLVSRTKINSGITYQQLNEYVLKYHLMVVNTTPVGMYPNISECVEFPFEFLTDQHLVVDLIYNPVETVFLKESKQRGAKTLNGMPMLIHQAERSWSIWNNKILRI
ncbi:MAG: shikimate dehydrogenase family protein [Flavobacteriales bacterium]